MPDSLKKLLPETTPVLKKEHHTMTGYLHQGYADSLSEFGSPVHLPHSRGWIMKRRIPGTIHHDAMGCYPIFMCRNWSRLHMDLADIGDQLLTLTLVADPFGSYDINYLQKCFKDLVKPFKDHYVIDLSRSIATFVCSHHRRNALNALRKITVEICEEPLLLIDEWCHLYGHLVKRHGIKGISAFSESAFSKQLEVPGLVASRAVYNQKTIGINLWYIHEDVGYYHLGASSPLGYELRASFALFWLAIEYFAEQRLKWLSLGAGAGFKRDTADGLSRFKRGWSTHTKTAFLCGRIFNPELYLKIATEKGNPKTDFFPTYREEDFGPIPR